MSQLLSLVLLTDRSTRGYTTLFETLRDLLSVPRQRWSRVAVEGSSLRSKSNTRPVVSPDVDSVHKHDTTALLKVGIADAFVWFVRTIAIWTLANPIQGPRRGSISWLNAGSHGEQIPNAIASIYCFAIHNDDSTYWKRIVPIVTYRDVHSIERRKERL